MLLQAFLQVRDAAANACISHLHSHAHMHARTQAAIYRSARNIGHDVSRHLKMQDNVQAHDTGAITKAWAGAM